MVDYKSKYNHLLLDYTKLKKGTLLSFQEVEIQDLHNTIKKLQLEVTNLQKRIYNRNRLGWKHTIQSLICIKWRVDEVFTLQDFYNLYSDVLQKLYPDNKTIEASIQGTLQKLRDDKLITFLNRGSYVLI